MIFSSLLGRESYFGFFVDWFIELIAEVMCLIVFVTSATLYIGLCLYINGMVMDMKTEMACSNFILDKKIDLPNYWSTYAMTIDFHCEIIEYVSCVNFQNISKLFNIFIIFLQFSYFVLFSIQFCSVTRGISYIVEVILFSLTMISAITIALNLLAFEINDVISLEMMTAFFDLFIVLNLTFAHYYLSERLTANLLEIGDIFYNSAWLKLPVKQQRLLVISLERGHCVFRLRGLRLFDCSLANFAMVIFFDKFLL